ncbi:MAG: hypothetical protein KDA37_08460, partial [Planctomycetales bacterium]|nr:hypothetical protein [Planctomycetales bacterium]
KVGAKQLLERAGSEEELPGDAPLTGLQFHRDYVFAAQGSRLLRVRATLGMLFQFRVVREALPDSVDAYCLTPDGYLLTSAGGKLAFYDPSEPKSPARMTLESGLQQVRTLAYSPLPRPAEPLLYAFGATDSQGEQAGVYRLDASQDPQGRLGCQPVLIQPLAAPVAMAFDAGGALYVLDGENLLRIEGDL